jgi:hypothetical protein
MKSFIHICVYGLLLFGASDQARGEPGDLLIANFNNLPLDQQIATDGPEFGEPVTIGNGLSAIVRAAPRPTPSLEISLPVSNTVLAARFEFLGSEEIIHGDVTIRLEFRAIQMDAFKFSVREVTTSAQSFATLALTTTGDLSLTDRNGFGGVIGQYLIDTDHQLAFKFHMDAGTYDIELDSVPVLTDRSHGVTGRGVGALLIGTNIGTLPGSLLYVDHIRVVRGDGIFRNGFD